MQKMILIAIIAACVMALSAVAMVLDLRTRMLPNWLTVPAFVAALVFHGATGGLSGLGTSLAGFAIGFGILLVLWLIGGGGGGDVKLMGAIGAWIGPGLTVIVFLATVVIAVAVVVTVFVWKVIANSNRKPAKKSPDKRSDGKNNNGRPMPYAVPVAFAVWGVMILKLIAVNASNN